MDYERDVYWNSWRKDSSEGLMKIMAHFAADPKAPDDIQESFNFAVQRLRGWVGGIPDIPMGIDSYLNHLDGYPDRIEKAREKSKAMKDEVRLHRRLMTEEGGCLVEGAHLSRIEKETRRFEVDIMDKKNDLRESLEDIPPLRHRLDTESSLDGLFSSLSMSIVDYVEDMDEWRKRMKNLRYEEMDVERPYV